MSQEENPESRGFPAPPQHSKGAVDAGKEGHSPFPIIGVGASAGGFEAFQQLLEHLPEKTGMALVFVQHLNPHHESRLTDLLSRVTAMAVVEAGDDLAVQPDHVYVIPPNANLAIAEGVLRVTPRPESRAPHLPVDYFFRTLAEDQKSQSVGVILSGTGSDGTQGLCEIKAVGGITFAQDEKSAKYSGMPHSAAESGCADFILPPAEIAERLGRMRTHPYLVPTAAPLKEGGEEFDSYYRKILARIRSITGVDFAMYRDTTIKRRIMRRMALHGQDKVADYLKSIEGDVAEVDALYRDLLINVTYFFRDPELFEVLKSRVFPEIIQDKSATTPLRMWVPGCSTGQEAYSLAMALMEFLDDKPVRPPVQIFATDLSDPASLERARAGVYPEGIEMEVSSERLRRFFRKEDHIYRVEKVVRDMCVFARQNLTSDPPFSRVDLISCRNVLIYLSTPLQRRVLPTLHYALNVPGYLVLGSAESVGENTDLFELADRTHKIYLKKSAVVRPQIHFNLEDLDTVMPAGAPRSSVPLSTADFQREADRLLLGRYAPPGVLVNGNFDIIQFRGRTSAYLEPPPGEPTNNVLKLAREGLFLELRSALTAAAKQQHPVVAEDIRIRVNGGVRSINLEVVPVKPPNSNQLCFLILFHDPTANTSKPAAFVDRSESIPVPESASAATQEIIQLQRELAATKEYMQSLIEQQDAANEELRSANEEILSSNEELQSTNEELETAKEELQATNEELTTVNEQLQYRNAELNQITNDLQNLITSTDIPVVMVGADMRIRRFTSAARRLMNLVATDIGRPIGDLSTTLDVPNITGLIEEVIDQVQVREREVRNSEGRWHMLRIHPYRTSDRRIDGAVVALVDIDDIKKAQKAVEQHAELLELTHEAIFAYEWGGAIVYWNRGAEELYGYTRDEAIGRNSHALVGTDAPTATALQQELNRSGHWVGELLHRTRDGRQVMVESRQQVFTRSDGRRIVLETNRDVSDRKHLERELGLRLEELKKADQQKNEFLATLAHELRNPLAPVLSVVELLKSRDLSAEEAAWCQQTLEHEVKQIARLLDDLLDIGRITGGSLELRRSHVDVGRIINNAVETTRQYIEAQEHKLEVDITPQALVTTADPARLEQVFSNLLNNAAKYTPRGGNIRIAATRERNEVVVRVKDTGIGIPAELLPRIFDLFVQEKYSVGQEPGGLGLGLTLVRNIVTLHGGTVEAQSAGRGHGSEFIVRLPIGSERTQTELSRELPPLIQTRSTDPKQVLVVDDREEQIRAMRMVLERMGHTVRVASDATAALAILAEHPTDVALIDIGLAGGIDGYEVARRIRQQPDLKNILLIAATGWGRDVDRRRSQDAGFDYHLVKPIDWQLLREILDNHLSKG